MPDEPLAFPSKQQRQFWGPCSTRPGALGLELEQRHAQCGPALPSTTQHALKTVMTLTAADPLEREQPIRALAKLRRAELPARGAPVPDGGAFLIANGRLFLRRP